MGSEFSIVPGGKGANQAVAAARSGAQVTMIGCVGDDQFGKQTIGDFMKEGISTECIKVMPGISSGIALIIVDKKGENMLGIAPGANAELTVDAVEKNKQKFEETDIVLLQLEVPWKTVEYSIHTAKQFGKPVILNPAPAPEKGLPKEIYPMIDYLTPNETEASLLAGCPTETGEQLQKCAEKLHGMGARHVLITLGKDGVLIRSGQGGQIPARSVTPVDTTAAGDAFNGALAYALAEKKPLFDAAEFAGGAASLSVTKKGAQPSLPTREEIDEFLKNTKK